MRELEESKYEVVAGARRLRAARIAELENLPVRIVKLTDAEAIEAQCVENLQREDIHSLEEALGFKSLLELGEPTYTIATIASRAGKSEAYVYGRVRLADLIPPVAEAFLKDQITIGHALLIAKLPASQQQEAFSASFRGLWTSEGNSQVLIPVRELAAWIESNILLQLASAPFDKQDETLVPEAGSCANCPKRTGFNKLLFPDVRKDSCTSPDCFRAKIDACVTRTLETKPQLIQISAAWNSREGAPLGRNQYVELEIKKPKPNGASTKLSSVQKPCEKMAEAIVMDGSKRGQVVKVCADPACRIHHPNTPSPQAAQLRANAASGGAVARPAALDRGRQADHLSGVYRRRAERAEAPRRQRARHVTSIRSTRNSSLGRCGASRTHSHRHSRNWTRSPSLRRPPNWAGFWSAATRGWTISKLRSRRSTISLTRGRRTTTSTSPSPECAHVVSSTWVAVRARSAVPSPNVVTG